MKRILLIDDGGQELKELPDLLEEHGFHLEDILDLPDTEDALHRQGEKYDQLFRDAPIGAFRSTVSGRFHYVSTAMARMLRYDSSEELIRVVERDGIAETIYENPRKRQEVIERVLGSEGWHSYEERLRCKDGSSIVCMFHIRSTPEEHGIVLDGFVENISERKRMENALELSRFIMEKASISIMRGNREGKILYANEYSARSLGYTAEELCRMTFFDIDPNLTLQSWIEHRQILEATGTNSFESVHRRKDGSIYPVEVTVNYIKFGDQIFSCSFSKDITERKQAEEMFKKANEEMLRAQKLESLGVLAGGIAHGFNNILTGITGNLSLACYQMNEHQKLEERISWALQAANRAKDLTGQLLTFAKGGEPVKRKVYPGEFISRAAAFAVTGHSVSLEVDLAKDLCPVKADEGQISQVIHNIVINAIEAMPQGGPVKIKAENVYRADRKMVHVSITDSGTGIPEEILGKIFDPFFTTKDKGSGLGLATCHSVIKKHGGSISANSIVGAGSTFNVYLPAVEEENTVEPVQDKPESGKGRILIMDDEELVRNILTEALRELGYVVDSTADGVEALELYRRAMDEGNPFDAVILDLTVPGGVGGLDALRNIQAINRDVKAIVSSGYSTSPVLSDYAAFGFSGIIAKPFRVSEVSKVLHDLLAQTLST